MSTLESSGSSVDNWTGHGRTGKDERSVRNLLLISGFHTESDEIIFVN
jgi:hypothetical protein